MSKLYYLPGIVGPKKGKQDSFGPISQSMRNEYWALESAVSLMFKTNGNNLARAEYEGVENQANTKADIAAGTDKGMYANDQINRGCCFCNSVPNQVYRKNIQDPKWRKEIRRVKKLEPMYPASTTYEELVTPVLFLFDKSNIEEQVRLGFGKYYLYAGESPTHTYADRNEPLKETLIYLRENMPTPKKLIIGEMVYNKMFKQNEMIQDWDIVYQRIIERYPDIDIIHVPNLRIGLGKDDLVTGNLIVSRKPYRVLKTLLSIVDGKIKPTRTL